MTSSRWWLFGTCCLLAAALPTETSGGQHQRRQRRNGASKLLADDSIRADIETFHDVTSASSVRKRFVAGRIGERLTSGKITGKRRKTMRKDKRDEIGDGSALPIPVNASYSGLAMKTMDRSFYNVIGEVRFIKNELLYVKHQGHVIWENVTNARRDHKRISTILWRILGNVTLVLSNVERTSRSLNEFHRAYMPMGQRLDTALGMLLGNNPADIRRDVNNEVGKSKQEMLRSVDDVMDEVRGLRRSMLHMGQSLPDFQRNVQTEFVKMEAVLGAGYKLLSSNVSDVNSKLYDQMVRMATIDRNVAETSGVLRDMSLKNQRLWNIVIVLFDRIAEIGSALFSGNGHAYHDAIDTRNRLHNIANQLETISSSVNGFKSILESVKPKLRGIRRAVWKKCGCRKTDRPTDTAHPDGGDEDLDQDDQYDDYDELSIYDESGATDHASGKPDPAGGTFFPDMTISSATTWFPTQTPHTFYPPYPSSTVAYPTSSHYYPPNYPQVTVHPQPFPPTPYPTTTTVYYQEAPTPPSYPGQGTWPPAPGPHPPYPIFHPTTTQQHYPGTSTPLGPVWYPVVSQAPGQGAWPPPPPGASGPLPPPPPYPTFQPTTSFYYPTTHAYHPGHPTAPTTPQYYPPPPPYPTFNPTTTHQFPAISTSQRPMWYPPPHHPVGHATTAWPPGSQHSPSLMVGCGQLFSGMCVCACACDCNCPALKPSEMAVFGNATAQHPEAPAHAWETECRCLCPCPCLPDMIASAGGPQVPPFEPPPPPPPFFPGGSGHPAVGGAQNPTPDWHHHHHELLNEIVRANKILRDDLETTKNLIKSEHETTRHANNVVTKNSVDYAIQHTGAQFEESHRLSRESIEMIRIVQTQVKATMEKMAHSLQGLAVNILQFHKEIDNTIRYGKQRQPISFDPSDTVTPKARGNYHNVVGPWQTPDDHLARRRDDDLLSRLNRSMIDAMAGHEQARRTLADVKLAADDARPSRRSGGRRGRKSTAGRKRGKKGAVECVVLDEYARGSSPYELAIASNKPSSARTSMTDRGTTMIDPLVDPFAFHNMLQRHMEKQFFNAIYPKPAINFGGKSPSRYWHKGDRYDPLSPPMFPGFPLIAMPVIPRPRLPTIDFPALFPIGGASSYVPNVLREMARSGAVPPYSISYNDGKGSSWNVNFANGPSHSKRVSRSSTRLAEKKNERLPPKE